MDDELERIGVVYEEGYRAQQALPVYFLATTPEHTSMTAGREYYVTVVNEELPEQYWLHKALCVGSAKLGTIENVPPILLAFVTETRSREDAKDRLKKYIESDQPLELAVMFREDVAQEFVMEGLDAIPDSSETDEAVNALDYSADKSKNSTVIKKELEEN